MALHISGYSEYRSRVIPVKTRKSEMFSTKKTTEIHRTHAALYGSSCRRTDTIPVPMLTANHLAIRLVSPSDFAPRFVGDTHDGVKFLTILLHPTLSLSSFSLVHGVGSDSCSVRVWALRSPSLPGNVMVADRVIDMAAYSV